jgi:hypothetical protein
MQVTGWSRGLEVSGGGQGVVSHAGLALLRLAMLEFLVRWYPTPIAAGDLIIGPIELPGIPVKVAAGMFIGESGRIR